MNPYRPRPTSHSPNRMTAHQGHCLIIAALACYIPIALAAVRATAIWSEIDELVELTGLGTALLGTARPQLTPTTNPHDPDCPLRPDPLRVRHGSSNPAGARRSQGRSCPAQLPRELLRHHRDRIPHRAARQHPSTYAGQIAISRTRPHPVQSRHRQSTGTRPRSCLPPHPAPRPRPRPNRTDRQAHPSSTCVRDRRS